jgi:putative RNA 2'-phosphotransferase
MGTVDHTSRYIALLLRHKPEAAGLTLAPQGWVEMSALIRSLNTHGHPIDRAGLEALVAADAKHYFGNSIVGCVQ